MLVGSDVVWESTTHRSCRVGEHNASPARDAFSRGRIRLGGGCFPCAGGGGRVHVPAPGAAAGRRRLTHCTQGGGAGHHQTHGHSGESSPSALSFPEATMTTNDQRLSKMARHGAVRPWFARPGRCSTVLVKHGAKRALVKEPNRTGKVPTSAFFPRVKGPWKTRTVIKQPGKASSLSVFLAARVWTLTHKACPSDKHWCTHVGVGPVLSGLLSVCLQAAVTHAMRSWRCMGLSAMTGETRSRRRRLGKRRWGTLRRRRRRERAPGGRDQRHPSRPPFASTRR